MCFKISIVPAPEEIGLLNSLGAATVATTATSITLTLTPAIAEFQSTITGIKYPTWVSNTSTAGLTTLTLPSGSTTPAGGYFRASDAYKATIYWLVAPTASFTNPGTGETNKDWGVTAAGLKRKAQYIRASGGGW
jgi:hypothetical protein